MRKLIKIGTRKSLLALAQSNGIKAQIEGKYPDTAVELHKIVTKGDKILDVPLAKVGGKGLFVKELEEALLSGAADMAVHSMKDVPAELPVGLCLGIITKREDPRDAFVANNYKTLNELPEGARIGTSSLRRRSQLAILRPDLVIEDLRGNLDTRLRKLDEGQYEAIILAAAGLNRLKLSGRISSLFDSAEMLPAVGQGAVGIELRSEDKGLLDGLGFLAHRDTFVAVTAERAFLLTLEGGCQVPIAGHCRVDGDHISLTGLVASIDGKEVLKKTAAGLADDAAAIGRDLAKDLLNMGARAILEEVYGQNMAVK
ncbi:MAG: hydroxymethylbilane synthase [Deltaproteobacteria bacterium]|nr:hydroxymethylbilane synthase [Deltaproteobacteria bacterium]